MQSNLGHTPPSIVSLMCASCLLPVLQTVPREARQLAHVHRAPTPMSSTYRALISASTALQAHPAPPASSFPLRALPDLSQTRRAKASANLAPTARTNHFQASQNATSVVQATTRPTFSRVSHARSARFARSARPRASAVPSASRRSDALLKASVTAGVSRASLRRMQQIPNASGALQAQSASTPPPNSRNSQ